jgi:hypothetical protein
MTINVPGVDRSDSAAVTPTTDAVSWATRALAQAVDLAQVKVVRGDGGDYVEISTLDLVPTRAKSIADRLTAGMSGVEVREWTAGGSRFVDVSGRLLAMRVVVTRFVGPVASTEPLAETRAVMERVTALAGAA